MVQTAANRRRASRAEYHTAGTIKSNLRNTELPCVVEDLSETGAKLLVENVNHIPDTFQLGITGIHLCGGMYCGLALTRCRWCDLRNGPCLLNRTRMRSYLVHSRYSGWIERLLSAIFCVTLASSNVCLG